ncbi:hypothetical protein DYB32_007176 [Aphanomyces invadans]|uniref:Arf-GAP domain-containing protein n=1 Tax=Aphanomyces invadans TaxID=157072 RepID=A0A418ARU2_9STRA|nr:hypothetical protein DYB32_007176 [Aphanomyces invadans]
MSTPEAALNTLRKLDVNKACANCDTVAKFGHGNICEKFKTFVCNHCKSAHQSYSHRVKEDVDALKEENGGGNAAARRTWLATWEDGRSMRKPLETDHLDVFKKFINAVYNDKAFYSDAAPQRCAPRQPAKTSPPPTTSSIASTDLLGFSPPSSSSSALSSAGASFEATFDAFSAPVPPVAGGFAQFDAFSAPVQPPAAPTIPKHDEWYMAHTATDAQPRHIHHALGAPTNITFGNGGGASISALLDPTMVANPHLQHQRSFGAYGGVPPQQQPSYQQPNQYQQPYQQGGSRPQPAAGVQSSGGRDPFAGLAFK